MKKAMEQDAAESPKSETFTVAQARELLATSDLSRFRKSRRIQAIGFGSFKDDAHQQHTGFVLTVNDPITFQKLAKLYKNEFVGKYPVFVEHGYIVAAYGDVIHKAQSEVAAYEPQEAQEGWLDGLRRWMGRIELRALVR